MKICQHGLDSIKVRYGIHESKENQPHYVVCLKSSQYSIKNTYTMNVCALVAKQRNNKLRE